MSRRLATFVPPLLVALLALPFIQRQNSWWEWSNAYWLLERQTEHVSAHGVPTLFLNNVSGAFNPFYTFYAGFTLSVLAYPAAVIGAWPVFAGTVVAAIVCGYVGIWWTARNLGLSPQLAVLPGLVFTTAPYVLSEIYGRGAWAELVAVNAAAVLLGALTAMLWRPEGQRTRSFAALVASTAVIAGTHNLTLLLSAILLPLLLVAMLPLRPAGSPRLLPTAVRAAGAGALGAGLTAAWLLPNLWFGGSTWIAQESTNDREFSNTHGVLTLANVLSPLPSIPEEFSDRWVYAQAPSLAAAWAIGVLVVLLLTRRPVTRRAALSAGGLVALGLALLALIVDPGWWHSFPRLVKTVQFPYRLIPYLAVLVVLGVILGLAHLRGRARPWLTGLLVAIVALQAAAGVWVVVNSEASASLPVPTFEHGDYSADVEPASFSSQTLLLQYQFRVAEHPTGGRTNRPPALLDMGNLVTADAGTIRGVGRVGDRMMVPVVWSRFVRVTGDARIVGRDWGGATMIGVTRTEAGGHWHATVSAAHPWQLVVGRIISVLSALILAALAVLALIRWRRERRDAEGPAVAEAPAEPRAAVRV